MSKVIPIDGAKLRLPGPRDRISIIGPTGSGKTHAGTWHLSNASFDRRPYLVINPKREELILSIENLEQMDVSDEIPKYPGIYNLSPMPSDADLVNDLLMRAWDRENVGVWFDEGFMFGTGDGVDAIFTQGRSKHIPVIFLMQRPVWVSRFAVSEATFIQYFGLTDTRDRSTVAAFTGGPTPERSLPVDEFLPEFHSFYYDVPKKRNFLFKPMPSAEEILSRIDSRLDAMYGKQKRYAFL